MVMMSESTEPAPDVEDTTPVRPEPMRPRRAGPPTHRGGPLPPPDAGYWHAQPEEPPHGTAADWLPADPELAESARPARAFGAGPSVPPWLLAISVLALLTMVGILGFITPGFFVTKVFDQAAVQNGVRSVLINDYRLRDVGEVLCPAGQRVVPARDFICVARVNNSPAQVRVVIRDSSGQYQVSRPN
jgi:Domain of unknown function (DUF4333)